MLYTSVSVCSLVVTALITMGLGCVVLDVLDVFDSDASHVGMALIIIGGLVCLKGGQSKMASRELAAYQEGRESVRSIHR